MEEAARFLKPLQLLASDNMQTHVLAFEIYFRKNKLLLMLQSLKRGHSLDPSHHALHECRIKFLKLGTTGRKSKCILLRGVANKISIRFSPR